MTKRMLQSLNVDGLKAMLANESPEVRKLADDELLERFVDANTEILHSIGKLLRMATKTNRLELLAESFAKIIAEIDYYNAELFGMDASNLDSQN